MYNSSTFRHALTTPTSVWDYPPNPNQFNFIRPPGPPTPFNISSSFNPLFLSQSQYGHSSRPTPTSYSQSSWTSTQFGVWRNSRNSSRIPISTEPIRPPVRLRPINSIIDLTEENWDDPRQTPQAPRPARRVSQVSEALEPKQSSASSVVKCEIMNSCRYFISANVLPQKAIELLTKSVRNCHSKNGRVHFDNGCFTKVASLLMSLNPPIRTGAEPAEKPQKVTAPAPRRTIPIPSVQAISSATNRSRTRTREIEAVRDRLRSSNKTGTTTNVLVPSQIKRKCNPKSSRGTTTSTKTTTLLSNNIYNLSRQESSFKIPGYEILKHLASPSTLTKTLGGNFYKKFQLVLSSSDASRFYAAKNGQIIILRLIQSKGNASAGESFQEAGDSMTIENIRFNGQSPSYQERKKAGHFNVDVTRYLKDGVSTTVEISANINGSKSSDDTVVYSISIVRILSAHEMLKDLKAKSPISVNVSRKMVVDSLTEAAENGILTKDSKLSVSLKCPLGKNQMITPCRGVGCDHFPCFDALNFLQTYEKVKISNWTCPVCDSHLEYEDLRVDSFLEVIVSVIGEDSKNFNVNIDVDGNFSVDSKSAIVSESQPAETVALIDDEEDEDILDILSSEDENDNQPRVQPKNKRTIVQIDSSSDDEVVEFGSGVRDGRSEKQGRQLRKKAI